MYRATYWGFNNYSVSIVRTCTLFMRPQDEQYILDIEIVLTLMWVFFRVIAIVIMYFVMLDAFRWISIGAELENDWR